MKALIPAVVVICALVPIGAQNSKSTITPDRSSRAVSGSTSKPLTPKTSMPTTRKSSISVPATKNESQKASTELSHLERGDQLASASQKKTPPAKTPQYKTPSTQSSPPLNATYKKPSTSTAVKKAAH